MWYQHVQDKLYLNVYIQPGAKVSEIAGVREDALKIKLQAPPVDGKANEALIKFIANVFKIPNRNIEIRKGLKSRHKLLIIKDNVIKPESLL